MADNDIDPAASTQMFRAFVETPEPQTPAAASGGSRTGLITAVVIVAVVVVAAVAWLALK
ncbi:hypothetical protein [Peterkaempfera bronchialis]|uniref:Uncharacterized protein n=1 Tax=Peterkaempfera bronchialis TaxID=2126346 RepID=A0A345SYD8_9ACTN|nr:hypothetical protein [Peterkaempfera bronchialis]AXI78743.1 hypothetical protein C7M71_016245 [Peterkaempfera bronchialis]